MKLTIQTGQRTRGARIISSGTFLGLLFVAMGANADTIVFTAYNDGPGGLVAGGLPAPPDPWYGSANTAYYGDAGTAQAFDPDIDAVRFFNSGASAISLQAASIGSHDLFALDSIASSVTINPGQNAILAGVDGSDVLSGLQTVTYKIDGVNFSLSDVATANAPHGVLFGNDPWVNGVETVGWTQISPNTTATPVPSTLVMSSIIFGTFVVGWSYRQRRRTTVAG